MNNRVARCETFVTPTNPRFIDKAWTSSLCILLPKVA